MQPEQPNRNAKNGSEISGWRQFYDWLSATLQLYDSMLTAGCQQAYSWLSAWLQLAVSNPSAVWQHAYSWLSATLQLAVSMLTAGCLQHCTQNNRFVLYTVQVSRPDMQHYLEIFLGYKMNLYIVHTVRFKYKIKYFYIWNISYKWRL